MDFASDIWQLTVLFRLNPANNWKLVLASIAILWIPGACCHLAYKLETQPSLSTRNILLNIILHPVIYPIRILVSLCNKSSEKDLEDSYLLAVRGSLVTPMQFILQSCILGKSVYKPGYSKDFQMLVSQKVLWFFLKELIFFLLKENRDSKEPF